MLKMKLFCTAFHDSVVICNMLFSPHFVLTNANECCTDIVCYLDVI